MKIGIVTEYYYPTLGGMQEHVHHFAVAARRLGHDVRIVTPAVEDSLASTSEGRRSAIDLRREDESFGVVRIGRSIPLVGGVPRLLPELAGWARTFEPTVRGAPRARAL